MAEKLVVWMACYLAVYLVALMVWQTVVLQAVMKGVRWAEKLVEMRDVRLVEY